MTCDTCRRMNCISYQALNEYALFSQVAMGPAIGVALVCLPGKILTFLTGGLVGLLSRSTTLNKASHIYDRACLIALLRFFRHVLNICD